MPSQKTDSNLSNIRHSLSHLLAAAVLKKYPDTKLGIGPVVDNGFYYDFLFSKPASDSDLKDLEKEMRSLIAKKIEFEKETISLAEAKKLFKDQPFKLELAEEYAKEGKELTIYRSGDFTDLCEGGHVEDTSEINPDAFKLTK
ncbi:MAG: threonine--tRNA ligase, partial [Patescibacteria group bacterium]